MRDERLANLDRECVTFARYLTGQTPGPYVTEKYRDAHLRHDVLRAETSTIERTLLRVARATGPGAWLVDAYTAIFLRKAPVRKKWVLLVAILESCAPTAEYFERTGPRRPSGRADASGRQWPPVRAWTSRIDYRFPARSTFSRARNAAAQRA